MTIQSALNCTVGVILYYVPSHMSRQHTGHVFHEAQKRVNEFIGVVIGWLAMSLGSTMLLQVPEFSSLNVGHSYHRSIGGPSFSSAFLQLLVFLIYKSYEPLLRFYLDRVVP